MTSFSYSGTAQHTVTAAPVRGDGSPGSIPTPLTWAIDPPTGLATLNPIDSTHERCVITPSGQPGTATVTVTGKDENGLTITSSFGVTFSDNTAATTGYTFTSD